MRPLYRADRAWCEALSGLPQCGSVGVFSTLTAEAKVGLSRTLWFASNPGKIVQVSAI